MIIDSLETKELKAILYGENNLIIHKGKTNSQVFKAYGESRIDVEELLNTTSKVTSYGGSTFNLNSTEEIKVWAFGDVNINYAGNAQIHKLITIGDVKLTKTE
ncbi:GIN domain-containing protein [Olivibacter ginsenosidimutans]